MTFSKFTLKSYVFFSCKTFSMDRTSVPDSIMPVSKGSPASARKASRVYSDFHSAFENHDHAAVRLKPTSLYSFCLRKRATSTAGVSSGGFMVHSVHLDHPIVTIRCLKVWSSLHIVHSVPNVLNVSAYFLVSRDQSAR